MSEFQYVAFRAIDRPVSDKDLAYMRQQSSHAEITPRSFDSEYHYGDFRGDTLEMLHRGFDIHLHYADFGIRRLLIRLPHGLPNAAAKPYLLEESLYFKQDKAGSGGALWIEPWYEAGELDDLWDIDELIDRLIPLRAELLAGDLRPLYLAHLASISDGEHGPEESREGPVPAGLNQLSDAQQALAEFFGLDDALVAAAALESPSAGAEDDLIAAQQKWLSRQPAALKTAWLARLLADSDGTVRSEMLTKFRSQHQTPLWPTARPNRTIEQLCAAAEEIAQQKKQPKQKTVAAAARKRVKKTKRHGG